MRWNRRLSDYDGSSIVAHGDLGWRTDRSAVASGNLRRDALENRLISQQGFHRIDGAAPDSGEQKTTEHASREDRFHNFPRYHFASQAKQYTARRQMSIEPSAGSPAIRWRAG